MMIQQVKYIPGEDSCEVLPGIRLLSHRDLPQLKTLLEQLSVVGDLASEKLDRFYKSVSKSAFHQIHILELGGKVVGCATLLVEQKLLHGCRSVGHIEDVVIDKAHRQNGFGKLIICYLTEYAKQMGCYKVILDCDLANVGFYEKCNYVQHGVQMALYFSDN